MAFFTWGCAKLKSIYIYIYTLYLSVDIYIYICQQTNTKDIASNLLGVGGIEGEGELMKGLNFHIHWPFMCRGHALLLPGSTNFLFCLICVICRNFLSPRYLDRSDGLDLLLSPIERDQWAPRRQWLVTGHTHSHLTSTNTSSLV